MDEIFLVISILSLACYIILTNGKAGAKTIVRNAYARFPENIPYMSEYLEANAGIYVHQFVFGSFAKLQFKIFVIGGWACLPIAIYSIYNYGLLNILSCISSLTFLLKICTDTESFYSYNLSPQLLTQNTIKRLKNHFPTGIPSVIYEKLPQYDNVACMIMSNAFPNKAFPKPIPKTPKNIVTPLRNSLKIVLGTTANSKAQQTANMLMTPLAYFSVSNIQKADEINSDETLLKVAAIYYQILLAHVLNSNEGNYAQSQIVFKSHDTFISLAVVTLGKNCTARDMEDRIKAIGAFAARAVPTYPSTKDLVDYLIKDIYSSYPDEITLNNLTESINTWVNCYFPTVIKTLNEYKE